MGHVKDRGRRAHEEMLAGRPPGPNPRATIEARTRLRDREWLRARLHDDGLSLVAVADQLGVAQSAVSYWLRKHELRSPTAVQRIERQLAAAIPTEGINPVEWLRAYRDDGWSWTRIARALDHRVSPARLQTLAAGHGFGDPLSRLGPQIPAVARQRLDDAGWLHRRYHQQGATARELAVELGVHLRTIQTALRRADIVPRPRGPRRDSQ